MRRGKAADGDRELVADGLLTIPEAMAFLRRSRAELYNLFERGELVSLKQGRHRFVPKRAAVDYLAGRLARAGETPGPAA